MLWSLVSGAFGIPPLTIYYNVVVFVYVHNPTTIAWLLSGIVVLK